MDDNNRQINQSENATLAQFASFVQQLVNAPSDHEFLNSAARCLAGLVDSDFALIYLSESGSTDQPTIAFYVTASGVTSVDCQTRLCQLLASNTSMASVSGIRLLSGYSETSSEQQLYQLGVLCTLQTPLEAGAHFSGFMVAGSSTRQFCLNDCELFNKMSSVIVSCLLKDRRWLQTSTDASRQRSYVLNLEVLNHLAESLSSVSDLPLALEAVEATVRKLISCERVSYCELASNQNEVRISALRADSSDRVGQLLRLSDTGLDEVLLEGNYLHRRLSPGSDKRAERSLYDSGYRHKWSIPVPGKGSVRAALTVLAKVEHDSHENTESILMTLARLFGSALERIDAQEETEKKQLELEKRARTDSLTGLANRYEFESVIENLIQSTSRHHETFGVMYLDVDMFKHVNDTLGHEAGDMLLCTLSTRLQSLLKPQDLVARIGGDEFLLLVTNYRHTSELCELAERVLESVRKTATVMKRNLQPSLSIGLCEFPQHGLNASELLKHADIAMYQAKKSGRNRYQIFDEALASSLKNNIQLVEQLHRAVPGDELFVLYQPKVNAKLQEVIGVEALLRWRQPEQGLIPPDVFIPAAEQNNLIAVITDSMLSKSFAALAQLHRVDPNLTMAVNISAMDFSSQSNLISRLQHALGKAGLAPGSIELELTETAFLNNPESAQRIITELKSLGFRLALDDFGTGYSSLTYLVNLPIDCIKIDRSFVDGLTVDPRKQSVIRGLVGIAAGLGTEILAEGVETNEQLDWLVDAGCQLVQGYLISRPVTVDQIGQLIGPGRQDQAA